MMAAKMAATVFFLFFFERVCLPHPLLSILSEIKIRKKPFKELNHVASVVLTCDPQSMVCPKIRKISKLFY